jgi:Uma2 family endonuclease
MTVDDLESLPNDGWTYELLDSVLIREPLAGYEASSIGARLLARLAVYVEDHGLGGVTGEQGGYRLDPAHPRTTELGPDIAFVRADRLPPRDSPEYRKALQLAPDLVVEVASDHQYQPGMDEKAHRYLAFGTRLVWVVWPRYKKVDVWHPGDAASVAMGVGDILDGEDVVPGFRYPIARLFT